MPVAEKDRKKLGRPSDYSAAWGEDICLRIAEGESLTAICEGEGAPAYRTVMRWLDTHEEFRLKYAHARELQGDNDVDRIKDVAAQALAKELPSDVARVVIDALKWTAAKRKPKVYGDRQQLEVSGSLTLVNAPDEDLISELVELALSGRLGLPEGTEVVTQPEEGEEAWSEFS